MKTKFRKIATVMGTALMLTSTVAMAAAANFPAPFVQNGNADVAIVVGADAALSDGIAASKISSNLASALASQTGSSSGSSSSASGGDAVKIEGASDKWNIAENATQFRNGLLTKNDLPVVLADGTFKDKNNTDRRYTQEIQLNESLKLTNFADYDYKSEEPTVGFHIQDGSQVLSYTLSFVSKPHVAALAEQEIDIMGKTYYILKASNASGSQNIELLDSANRVLVLEGETSTVNAGGESYTVEISSVSNNEARLVINGESLPALKKGDTRKLADGSFVGIIDVVQASRERDVHKVEISIGTGKMTLTNGQDLRLNDKDDVRDIKAVVNYAADGNLNSLGLIWKQDREAFLTSDTSLTIPQFENLKLQVGAINFPKMEETRIETNGAERVRLITSVKDGEYNLDLAYTNSTLKAVGNYTGLGRDANNRLVVGTNTITYDETNKDRVFLVSWASNTEAETYVVSARLAVVDGQDTVTVRNEITGEEFCKDLTSGTCRVGRTDLTVSAVNATTGNLTATFAASTGSSFNTIYTKEGMKITLPSTVNVNTPAFNLTFVEEDRDGNIGAGTKPFVVTLGISNINSENRTNVISNNLTTQKQKLPNVDEYVSYVESPLATKLHSKEPTSSQKSVIVTYHGAEVSAEVYVSSPSATISGGSSGSGAGSLGSVTVTDAEAASVSSKNLIVIGGSCINSVAAELLGGAACESQFTAASGISTGEALIKSFTRNGKVAVLIAGYNAADTEKAVTYALNNAWDSSSVNVKVTSATSAEAIVA